MNEAVWYVYSCGPMLEGRLGCQLTKLCKQLKPSCTRCDSLSVANVSFQALGEYDQLASCT